MLGRMKIQPHAPTPSPVAPPPGPPAPASPVDSFQPSGEGGSLPDLARAAGLFRGGADQVWSSEARGALSEPRVAADGTILVGAFDHRIYGLDPATGRTRWSHKTASHLDDPPAAGPDGRLYATSRDLHLHILSPSGSPLARVEAGPTTSGPVVDGQGRVFLGTIHGEAKAFDPDGKPLWSRKLEDPHEPGYMVSPVLGPDGTVYFTASGGTLTAMDPASGEPRWTVKHGSGLYAESVVGPDGRLYVPYLDGNLRCLEPATGQVAWTARTGGGLSSSPVVRGDRLWALAEGGRLSCHRLSDGAVQWKADVGGERREAPPIPGPDGTLFVGDGGSDLLALDEATGAEKWRVRLDGPAGKGVMSPDGATVFLAVGRQGMVAVSSRSLARRVEEAAARPEGPAPRIQEEPAHVDIGGVRLPRRTPGN